MSCEFFATPSTPFPSPSTASAASLSRRRCKTGVAILFANDEPALEYQDYRQDEDFYYLTGWNEPGAAMVVIPAADAEAETPGTGDSVDVPAQPYREILFLPSRNPAHWRSTPARRWTPRLPNVIRRPPASTKCCR